MKIQDLRPAIGAKKRRKIIGRCPGSGHGKTSTRGHKGQRSRTGKTRRPGFEGGQMPLIRKMPKRGFNKRPKKGYCVINLERLTGFKEGDVINPELLKERGIIKRAISFLKILGKGKIDVPLTLNAHSFSRTVIDKVKNAGGKCEVIR